MPAELANLEQRLQSYGSPVEMLRDNAQVPLNLPVLPDVFTNVFDEQRSWRETCSFYDQSHHMGDLIVEGPDAEAVFSSVGTNSFDGFGVGKAKQLLCVNPDGYYIGDGILSHTEENRYRLVAPTHTPTWVVYNIEQGDFDVGYEFDLNTPARANEVTFDEDTGFAELDNPPLSFRYEIMGPNTIDVMREITDASVEDIAFFNLDTITIDGIEVRALQHSMGGEGGIELWGPWEHANEIKARILEAGEQHGMRRLGTLTYRSTACFSGWVHFPLSAVYSESMREYREWLDAESFVGLVSLSGSFYSDDITDYYMTPADIGLERCVAFDHDFVGRDALEDIMADPPRQLVMLEWDGMEVVDVYSTLFEEGKMKKFVELLDPSWGGSHYDEVRMDGEYAGVSKWPVYNYNERAIFSMAALDTDQCQPGSEVEVLWGIPEGEERPPNVEPHVQSEISATVHDVEAWRDQHR